MTCLPARNWAERVPRMKNALRISGWEPLRLSIVLFISLAAPGGELVRC